MAAKRSIIIKATLVDVTGEDNHVRFNLFTEVTDTLVAVGMARTKATGNFVVITVFTIDAYCVI